MNGSESSGVKRTDFSIESLLRKESVVIGHRLDQLPNPRIIHVQENCDISSSCKLEQFSGDDEDDEDEVVTMGPLEVYGKMTSLQYEEDESSDDPDPSLPILRNRKDSADFLLNPNQTLTEEELNTFSWLSCTRFKPPKLPRSKKRTGCKRYGRGPRIPFAPHQIAVLESTFSKSQYLSSDCIHSLADSLNLSETRVKIWFQNRRARYRREKESLINMPNMEESSPPHFHLHHHHAGYSGSHLNPSKTPTDSSVEQLGRSRIYKKSNDNDDEGVRGRKLLFPDFWSQQLLHYRHMQECLVQHQQQQHLLRFNGGGTNNPHYGLPSGIPSFYPSTSSILQSVLQSPVTNPSLFSKLHVDAANGIPSGRGFTPHSSNQNPEDSIEKGSGQIQNSLVHFQNSYSSSSADEESTTQPPLTHLATSVQHRYEMRIIQNISKRLRNGEIRLYHCRNGVYGYNPDISRPKLSPADAAEVGRNRNANSQFCRLADAFRGYGHRLAQINPLTSPSLASGVNVPELNVERYGLDLSARLNPIGILYGRNLVSTDVTVQDGIEFLKTVYTGKTGYEFLYIENEVEREWFTKRIEELSEETLENDYKVQIAIEMARSQNFDQFLANKFATVKRYGGEGCESLMAFFLELLKTCAKLDIDHIVLGMAHRGRLNTLTGPLNFPPVRMFQKMKGLPEFPSDARTSGDVLSHLSTSVDLDIDGKKIHFNMLPNSSHLEAVNPMAAGKVRSKMKSLKNYDYSDHKDENHNPRALCLQIHGDAAISGQGINQETLGFAYVPNFRTGGSIHLITNNQLGFTTPEERGRSSNYSSDIAKMISAPVIHVNADCPEEVVKATKLAVEYRQKFHRDVFIDLVCFRRWGHNELDDPTFTNPVIYSVINTRKSIPDLYSEKLINEGILTLSKLQESIQQHTQYLSDNLNQIESYTPPKTYLENQWSQIRQPEEIITTWDTGVDIPLLQYIGMKSVEFTSDFNVHPHLLKTYVKSRKTKATTGTNIDWATAETMAFGSLLYQGYGVRISGEDVGRGTFSHRHVMLVDQENGSIVIPLNSMLENQSEKLEVANTTLSEEAVLAFEYGFSIDNPNNMIVWEAQFGDFFNGAQIIIDAMVTSGETKWMLQSGIVMLLPHGMDGAGPEHSSCRIERFLQLTDSNEDGKLDGDYNNFSVVNPTTPAQYFHLLRRQMIRNFRKPLVVVAPKTLLRLPAAVSNLADMSPSTHFHPVLGDNAVNSNDVKKLIFVSGKHYYTLKAKREELNRKDIALIRLESLCPFPVQEIQKELSTYKNVQTIVWSQEEHQNMGAWTFVKPRFENFVGRKITYAGRGPLAAPAVGIGQKHRKETELILTQTFA